MQKILYFDCFAGISGDMTIAAFLDAGLDQKLFTFELQKLNLSGYEIKIEKKENKGIAGTKFDVILNHHHDHHHRGIKDIEEIINSSSLSGSIKKLALKIFYILGEAEAKVHNTSLDKIHFHEVGAIDSIIDIVGVSIAYHLLGIEKVISSPLNVGGGFVTCAHGVLPVPAPATAEILKGIPIYSTHNKGETVTPTGAAIIKALANEFSDLPSLKVNQVSYGLGTKVFDHPNALRMIIGDMESGKKSYLSLIETNIDNMNPEVYSYLFDKLFQAGALDVYITQLIMKKNRPGVMLSVICSVENDAKIEHLLFTETTTLGIRKQKIERIELERDFKKILTRFGEITLKVAYLNNEILKYAPEYEECKTIADRYQMPIKDVYNEILNESLKYIRQKA